jgi:hypothetical protein
MSEPHDRIIRAGEIRRYVCCAYAGLLRIVGRTASSHPVAVTDGATGQSSPNR